MKIEYSKFCFESVISFNKLVIYDSYDDHQEKPDVIAAKKIALILLEKINHIDLESIYRIEISHDYENPTSINYDQMRIELKERINKFNIKDDRNTGADWYDFFCFIKSMIECIGTQTQSYSCEQCGDYNYTIVFKI